MILRKRIAVERIVQKGSSIAVVDNLFEQNPNRDALEEECDDDVNEDYDNSSEVELDSNVRYENDDEDEYRW